LLGRKEGSGKKGIISSNAKSILKEELKEHERFLIYKKIHRG